MNATEIIDALGGPTIVSRALRLPSTTVGNWRARNSIPARYQQAVVRMSNGKITAEQIDAAHAPQPAACVDTLNKIVTANATPAGEVA
jgi:hypothetical protein